MKHIGVKRPSEASLSVPSSLLLLMLGFKDFQFNKHWMQQSSSLKESFINFSESKQSSLKMLKTQEIINSLVDDWCSLSTIVLSTWWRWDQIRVFCLIDSSCADHDIPWLVLVSAQVNLSDMCQRWRQEKYLQRITSQRRLLDWRIVLFCEVWHCWACAWD